MSRVPIRLRVTLAFALAMAVLLAGLALFIYLRMSTQLTATVDTGLRSRSDEVAALVQEHGTGGLATANAQLTEREESFAQVLTPGDQVFDSSPQLGDKPVLTPSEVDQALQVPITIERFGLAGTEGASRLLASGITAQGRQLIVVVGASLEDRDDALSNLSTVLILGSLAGLLLASASGYFVAGRALRPIDAMRGQAAALSADQLSERLELPLADDEVRRLGETLNEMLARIEDAVERERVFVDDASHELRTPLALQRTELELALRHGQTTTELREAISSSLNEIDRVILLAEELLVVARADKGDLQLRAELVPLADVLHELAQRFSRTGAAVTVSPQSAEPVVAADRLRLEQALTNIVENAVRHGGGEVTVSAQALAETVVIRVEDRGPGFPEEFIERAFDRFARADPARGGNGVGLGLAIASAIVEAHGGTVRAENRPEGGGAVTVELPLVAAW
jgi:signal transduction histidine kinase